MDHKAQPFTTEIESMNVYKKIYFHYNVQGFLMLLTPSIKLNIKKELTHCVILLSYICCLPRTSFRHGRDATTWKIEGEFRRFEWKPFVWSYHIAVLYILILNFEYSVFSSCCKLYLINAVNIYLFLFLYTLTKLITLIVARAPKHHSNQSITAIIYRAKSFVDYLQYPHMPSLIPEYLNGHHAY